jgi:exonuclease SbcD
VPSAQATKIWTDFLEQLHKLHIQALVISGNHDSLDRLSDMKGFMALGGIYTMDRATDHIEEVVLKDEYGDIHFFLMPYIRPMEVSIQEEESLHTDFEATKALLKTIDLDSRNRNVLLAHLFVTPGEDKDEIGTLESIPCALFDDFDYVALGHLHGPHSAGRHEVRYSGSPLKYSLNEKDQKKSCTIIDLGPKGYVEINEIPLHPLRDVLEFKDYYNNFFQDETYLNHKDADYISFVALDENEPSNAMARLKEVYRFPLNLRYENTRTKSLQAHEIHPVSISSPLEVLEKLFIEMNHKKMSEKQIRLAKEIFAEVRSETKGDKV